MTFTVPLIPPSVNHYKKPSRRGGFYVTAEAQAYIDAVCLLSRGLKVTGDAYRIGISFYLGPPKQHLGRFDLDNFAKVAIDALVKAGCIRNDARIFDLYLVKRFVSNAREERTTYVVKGGRF